MSDNEDEFTAIESIVPGMLAWIIVWSLMKLFGMDLAWSWVFAPLTAPVAAFHGDYFPLIGLIFVVMSYRLMLALFGVDKV